MQVIKEELRKDLSIKNVVCTAVDAVGNTSTDNFNITVKDVNSPIIIVPADPTPINAIGINTPVDINSETLGCLLVLNLAPENVK